MIRIVNFAIGAIVAAVGAIVANPIFMLCAAITAVAGYVLGFQIWKAGFIFQFTFGLWGPAMLIVLFVLSARVFRLEG